MYIIDLQLLKNIEQVKAIVDTKLETQKLNGH